MYNKVDAMNLLFIAILVNPTLKSKDSVESLLNKCPAVRIGEKPDEKTIKACFFKISKLKNQEIQEGIARYLGSIKVNPDRPDAFQEAVTKADLLTAYIFEMPTSLWKLDDKGLHFNSIVISWPRPNPADAFLFYSKKYPRRKFYDNL